MKLFFYFTGLLFCLATNAQAPKKTKKPSLKQLFTVTIVKLVKHVGKIFKPIYLK
jgi:hypothetical protein